MLLLQIFADDEGITASLSPYGSVLMPSFGVTRPRFGVRKEALTVPRLAVVPVVAVTWWGFGWMCVGVRFIRISFETVFFMYISSSATKCLLWNFWGLFDDVARKRFLLLRAAVCDGFFEERSFKFPQHF